MLDDHNDPEFNFKVGDDTPRPTTVPPRDLPDSPLPSREKILVNVYVPGDEVYAGRVAGYTGTDAEVRRRVLSIVERPRVREALKKKLEVESKVNEAIATREERMLFLSSVMRNSDPHHIEELDEYQKPKPQENIPMAQRLKATELLGKAHGDFVENINVNHNISVSDLILKSFEDDTPIDVIEAEYKKVKTPSIEDLI